MLFANGPFALRIGRVTLDFGEVLFEGVGDVLQEDQAKGREKVVRAGVEPATHGFSVRCSTN
jgi:hypothetical protein